MAIVTVPASAQTNATNPDRAKIDCSDEVNATAADCVKDGGAKGRSGAAEAGAVFLPALIVDLFPNPAAPPAPVPTPRPEPAAPVAGNQAGPPSGGAIVSPTDLIAVQPPRAVTGEFVPDEVLVTVDGDAGAVQQIAASFG
ncbi:peptidase S8, partial [Mesorhizobium sp. M8A.F.Ca.ET.023.02.2.1]